MTASYIEVTTVYCNSATTHAVVEKKWDTNRLLCSKIFQLFFLDIFYSPIILNIIPHLRTYYSQNYF